jgi:hypothetical protein
MSVVIPEQPDSCGFLKSLPDARLLLAGFGNVEWTVLDPPDSRACVFGLGAACTEPAASPDASPGDARERADVPSATL